MATSSLSASLLDSIVAHLLTVYQKRELDFPGNAAGYSSLVGRNAPTRKYIDDGIPNEARRSEYFSTRTRRERSRRLKLSAPPHQEAQKH